MKPINAILVCSREEWEKFKEILPSAHVLSSTPFGEAATFKKSGNKYCAFNTGAGKVLSAGAVQYIINKYKPFRIFLIGCAGGVSEKVQTGDIIIGDSFVQYDYSEGMGVKQSFFNPDTYFESSIKNGKIKSAPAGCKKGLIATADVDIDSRTKSILISKSKKGREILCGDWESFAVAKICELNKVNYLVIRGITDVPCENRTPNQQRKEYRKNIKQVLEACLSFVCSGWI